MYFVIIRTSNEDIHETKDFSTIEELVDFMEKQHHPLVIQHNFWFQENPANIKRWYPHVDADKIITIPYVIEIYDDYRE